MLCLVSELQGQCVLHSAVPLPGETLKSRQIQLTHRYTGLTSASVYLLFPGKLKASKSKEMLSTATKIILKRSTFIQRPLVRFLLIIPLRVCILNETKPFHQLIMCLPCGLFSNSVNLYLILRCVP